ncbi:peptidase M15B and M15C DD-carboxypeptidase VanY/endolysin [Oleidesulfovibrio alaskensis G20]|jgi:hypothetical protein|uniref:Peptidase M15B and M15C DD-carboxypeptidase VanY/endolysin n=1 Tax=Oleidesulfovibrio alaskensis (strain ATCC BAA-1058 / DSM 17464 / G20) TaxID=207559 RepID=Q30UQ6_OLEA2|nr:M15 family metallopeptidase [Oleidesulfovibrio alaskensis]ABB36865.1 peptidase M15B and M15C DD-carboxypeptidase VanY/endolysin [Oleidesulfovibrio alaskensis G20]MBG0774336.1 D-alanyl-D-alanine carboxypeptidase family protein [Oleidesulfovibrio alaskensis]MBL3583501.1 M15 family metallopeptidase [Oleidesulfovibrio alaskensis]
MNRRSFLALVSGTCAALALQGGPAGAAVLTSFFPQQGLIESPVRDYVSRMLRFDAPDPADIVLPAHRLAVLQSAAERLARTEQVVGHGNFCILGFDSALRYAQSYPAIGPFTSEEKDLLDELFHEDATRYGFYGTKPVDRLTARIPQREVTKVPYTGNWLFRGRPERTWHTIRSILGDEVVLTSGVRGVVKQFLLFLNKAVAAQGNLSLASRSLAPPGYSFHAVSDFDVGKKGFGEANFTARFTETEVFKQLEKRGYITLRYPQDNLLGVRFEPWHVKVPS